MSQLLESSHGVPARVTLPLNHCNVSPRQLASLAFQESPQPLWLDGIDTWYRDLFERLSHCHYAARRAEMFRDYMAVRFRLPVAQLPEFESAGPSPRPKANYQQLLLGWLFDSDNDQGAVWRQWVESRFGLLTRYHRGPIPDPDCEQYHQYQQAAARGSYNTNALFSQLDLLYSFCQYQLSRRFPGCDHLILYRGAEVMPEYTYQGQPVMLFNNLSSFSGHEEEAFRFGPKVFRVDVPLTKIVCYESLLPGSLSGEQEYMVLGGLYRVSRVM